MKKITIYTTADKRPDFIPLQHETLKKFIEDEYEYIVLNNAIDSKYRRDKIFEICKKLNIRCIEVKKDSKLNLIGGQKAISWLGTYRNANVGTAYPIKWAWEQICDYNKNNVFIIIDSDMFLCRPISINKEMGGFDASFIMMYRGIKENGENADVNYIWNGICVFDTEKIKNIKDINWDSGIIKKSFIKGHAVDVGGYAHFWLQKNNIKIRHISEYAIIEHKENNGDIWLKGCLNGNFLYSFEYNEDKLISNFTVYEKWWKKGDKILPHMTDNFEETLINKTIDLYEKFILNKQTYPNPTFLGFIEFENFSKKNETFIIHNKAGSGYSGFGIEYGKQKLEFIRQTLGIKDLEQVELKDYIMKADYILKSNIKVVIRLIKLKNNNNLLSKILKGIKHPTDNT